MTMLEVAIGVVFVFLLVSIICTAIREGIEAALKTRATHLEEGIRELLHDPDATGLAKHFFAHPLIYGLYSGAYSPVRASRWWPTALTRGRNLPTYIPSRNFALALMDMAARGPVTDDVSSHPAAGVVSVDGVRANVLNIGNPAVQRVLLTAIDSAEGDLQAAVSNLEAWFDSGMDRVSGSYRRSTQWMLFVIAMGVAIGLNVNALTIADFLYRDEAARAALVARAEAATSAPDFQNRTYPQIRTEMESLRLPVGWAAGLPTGRGAATDWPEVILGWLVTALAATMGAPFWFDFLNKFMVIRSTVKPHEKSPEESSEDRQIGTAPRAPGHAAAAAHAGSTPPAGAAVVRRPASHAAFPATARPQDEESRLDGCDVAVDPQHVTRDDELPEAEGGVA